MEKIQEVTRFRVDGQDFNSKEEAKKHLELKSKKAGYTAMLKKFSDTLENSEKHEYYATEKEDFECFIEGLSDFLTENY